MDHHGPSGLESILEQWLITQNICQYLPVGDLLSLSRTNTTVRYLLHGFNNTPDTSSSLGQHDDRPQIHIGQHQTPFWQRLKQSSPFLCSCKQHTKGRTPKPCKYCSKPICEACIVKASFAKKQENTFKNRCRYLCQTCWQSGNQSQSHRFPIERSATTIRNHLKWEDSDGSTRDNCTCTLQKDGWLCLDCKAEQNSKAVEGGHSKCHGSDCNNKITEEDRERHRICLWCDKAIPRQLGGRTRYAWNQKLIDARALNAASRSADLEEYNRKRLQQLRTSRRELRGDDAVKGDVDADKPQYLRHLDTFNYRAHIHSEDAVPSGDDIYGSKRGYWRYNRSFLLQIGKRSKGIQPAVDVRHMTQDGGLAYCRTNLEKEQEFSRNLEKLLNEREGESEDDSESDSEGEEPPPFLKEWNQLKCRILQLLVIEEQDVATTRRIVSHVYGFDATVEQYQKALKIWDVKQPESMVRGSSSGQKEPDCPTNLDLECVMSDEQYAAGVQESLDRQMAMDMQADWAAESDTDSEEGTSPTKHIDNGKCRELPQTPNLNGERPVLVKTTAALGEKLEEVLPPENHEPSTSTAKAKTPVSLLSQSLQQGMASTSSNVQKPKLPTTRKRTNSHPLAEEVTIPSAFAETFTFGPRSIQHNDTAIQSEDQAAHEDAGELITLPDGTVIFDGPEDAFPSMDPLGPNGGDDLLRFAIANSYQRHSIDATNAQRRRASQIQEEIQREIALAAARSSEIVIDEDADASTMVAGPRRRSSASSNISAEEISTSECVFVDAVEEADDEYDHVDDEIGVTVGAVAIEVSDSDSDDEKDNDENNQKIIPLHAPIPSKSPQKPSPTSKPGKTTISQPAYSTSKSPPPTTTVSKVISPSTTTTRPIINDRNPTPPSITNTTPPINTTIPTDMPPSYEAVFIATRARNRV